MRKKQKKTLLLLFELAMLVAATTVQATSLAPLSLEQLATAAQVVARVRCVSNHSQWDSGEIWTLTRFEVLEALKGSAPNLVTVRLIGGQVGHVRSIVSAVPRFRPGEEIVLFLESSKAGDFSVIAWGEGTFRVHRDPQTGMRWLTQGTAEQTVFDPATRRFRPSGIRNMPFEDFRKRIAAAERPEANPQ